MKQIKESQVYGESIIWSIFVIINALAGLSLKGVINLSNAQQHFVGNIALAFSFLAFFYLTFLASKQRSK